MKALTMNERASSVLVSRATRAKDILKEKMTNSTRSAPVKDDDNQFQKQQLGSGHEKKMTTMHGMETSTREYDNHTNITSLVSPKSLLPSSSSLSNLPRTTKKAQILMSRAISSLSSNTSNTNPQKDTTALSSKHKNKNYNNNSSATAEAKHQHLSGLEMILVSLCYAMS